jgi:hypothetical protein
MKKLTCSIAAAALGGVVILAVPAEAARISGVQFDHTAADLGALKNAQFFYGGRNYCFYLDGWHGPGWYWCGYAFRRGYGWGGPEGWRGWHRGEYRRGERREERYERRDDRREYREDRRDYHRGYR